MVMVNGDPSNGMIQFEIDKVSTLNVVGKISEAVEVEGLPFRLKVIKHANDLEPYRIQKEKSVVQKREKLFNHNNTCLGVFGIDWDDLMDEAKGFVHDDKMSIEVEFTVKNIIGIRKVPRINFSDKDEPRHDIALEYLALHSPFFDRLFFGDFTEKRQKVVELKDVDPKEFKELLTVIYPTQQKITDSNYKYLLSMGDRYEMKMILDKVEYFLISSNKFAIPEKLNLADKYRLVKLHDHCLESFKTIQQITEITKKDSYKLLSNDAKAALMDKISRLSH